MKRAFAAAALFGVILSGRSGAQEQPAAPSGRITGVVIDQETARPIASAQISIIGTTLGTQTNMDGRYRTPPLTPGRYTVRLLRLGYRAQQFDSIQVKAGEATVLNATMQPAAATLAGVTVTADKVQRAASETGLLEARQKAPAVSDGISAEQITRTPDANAGDAMTRVPGVTVLDNKFVVVRGLSERYSNTLLNGVELPSPEPTRKIVPLDIFPSSLLEAVVTTKSGLPDRPGDFAGGSVDVQTKEFPENRVLQFSLSQGYNELATLKMLPFAPQRSWDVLGFDNGRRAEPSGAPPVGASAIERERFAESLPTLWTPQPRRVLPSLGAGFNLGGPSELLHVPLGYVLSVTYSNSPQYYPDRIYRSVNREGSPDRGYTYQEATTQVDLGAVANLSLMPTGSTKLSIKNLYTRNAEESAITANGFDLETSLPDSRAYQMRYVTREFLQNQLAIEQHISFLRESRLDLKFSHSVAGRDEPGNRFIRYARDPNSSSLTIATNANPLLWFRYFTDRMLTGQADWSVPFGLHRAEDSQLKVGVLRREKRRDFDAALYRYTFNATAPGATEVFSLPPEQALAAENVGDAVNLEKLDAFVVPYESSDDVTSWYAMIDAPLMRHLRVAGGVRQEDWSLELFSGSRAEPIGAPVLRHNPDLLWSANLTAGISNRMNLRLSAFTSVTRPDGRELSQDYYVPVVGQCAQQGSPDVERSRIFNGDLRWEWFTGGGHLLSLGTFYKHFDQPIVEALDIVGGAQCRVTFRNGIEATNYGGEVELRQPLLFLPGTLKQLSLNLNATYVASRVIMDSLISDLPHDTPLQGQSPVIVNASLGYASRSGRLSGTLLYNWFDDRITRYGVSSGSGGVPAPNVVEQGRHALDAKIQRRMGRNLTLTLSGKNLLNEDVLFYQKILGKKSTQVFYRQGVTFGAGVGIDF